MKKDKLYIRSHPIAQKYELFFRKKDNAFEIIFKKEYLDFLKTFDGFKKVTINECKEYKFKELWNFDSDYYFGYENCMKIQHRNDGKVSLSATITANTGLAVVCTLKQIFDLLNYFIDNESPKQDELCQEMFLETFCSSEPKIYGAVMEAQLSVDFSLWIYTQDDELRNTLNPKINESMRVMFKTLTKDKPANENYGLKDNGFLLAPPFGIYTCQFGILRQDEADFRQERPYGYKTFCHNLDVWQQQIILLAGFATLCEGYRNSIRT